MWEESLVFAESYRRLLAPEALVLFELVDVATALSRKEARKVRKYHASSHVPPDNLDGGAHTQERVFRANFFFRLLGCGCCAHDTINVFR